MDNKDMNKQIVNKTLPNYKIEKILKLVLDKVVERNENICEYYFCLILVCQKWCSIVKRLVKDNNYLVNEKRDYFYSKNILTELCKKLFNCEGKTGYHYVVKQNNKFIKLFKLWGEKYIEQVEYNASNNNKSIIIGGNDYGTINKPNKSLSNVLNKQVKIEYFENAIGSHQPECSFEFKDIVIFKKSNLYRLEGMENGLIGYAIFHIGTAIHDSKCIFIKNSSGVDQQVISITDQSFIICYGSCKLEFENIDGICIYKLKLDLFDDNGLIMGDQITKFDNLNGRFNCGSNNSLPLWDNNRTDYETLINQSQFRHLNKNGTDAQFDDRDLFINHDISTLIQYKIQNIMDTLNVNVGFITRDFYESNFTINKLSRYDSELYQILNSKFKVELKSLIMNERVEPDGFTYKVEEVSLKTLNKGIQLFSSPHTLIFNTLNDYGVKMFTAFYDPMELDHGVTESIVALNSFIVLKSNVNNNNNQNKDNN